MNIKQGLIARFKAKRYDVHKKDYSEKGTGYFIHNGVIYYGNRFFIFIESAFNRQITAEEELYNALGKLIIENEEGRDI